MKRSQSVVLVPYQIRVKKRGTKEYLALDKLPGGQQFLTLFRQFLLKHQYAKIATVPSDAVSVTVDEDEQTAFRVNNFWQRGAIQGDDETPIQSIDAMIELGVYGLKSTLVNVETASEREKDRSEADLASFYIRLDLHTGIDRGVLLVQEYGRQKCRGQFTKNLNRFFRENDDYSGFTLEVQSLVTEEYLESMTNGAVIKSVKLCRPMRYKDASDRLHGGVTDSPCGSVEIILRPNKGGSFLMKISEAISSLKESLNGKTPTGNLILVEPDAEYEWAKMEIEMQGRKRTLNLRREGGMLPFMSIDVSDDVTVDEDSGYPHTESIRKVAADIVRDMVAPLGWAHVPTN